MRILAGLGIISLLFGVGIFVFLSTKQLSQTSQAGGTKQTIDTATAIKNKADLKALSVKLNFYFSENESYPKSLAEIDTSGLDVTSFQYSFCNSGSVIVTVGDENLILNNGGENFSENSSQSHAACLSE